MNNIIPNIVQSDILSSQPQIQHAFFGCQGGVSEGPYETLNCGYGSRDDPIKVRENQRRALMAIGQKRADLATLQQIHSAKTVIVTNAWPINERPTADAMVTNIPGIALGIFSADCAPVLFCDDNAGIIGAAHAGWRGAKTGIIGSVLAEMKKLGATKANIRAAIGPTIGKASYEVNHDLYNAFLLDDNRYKKYFTTLKNSKKFLFDLPAFLYGALYQSGVIKIDTIGIDTYRENKRYFSCRRANHLGKCDYGRNLSVIVLVNHATKK